MKIITVLTISLALLGAAPASYSGPPDTALADWFIGSGGGPGSFSTIRAFDGMIGQDAVLSAERDLASTGGSHGSDGFIHQMDYAVADAWTVASRHDVKLGNAPAVTGQTELARSLVRDGSTPDGTFDVGYLFAHLFTPAVSVQVMQDLDARFGAGTSAQFTQSANRFFSDVAADVKS
jgi:hypothetical protein